MYTVQYILVLKYLLRVKIYNVLAYPMFKLSAYFFKLIKESCDLMTTTTICHKQKYNFDSSQNIFINLD